jgi:hypothetical protein
MDMTIAASWIRKAGKHEELVFASDSRLRCFGSWDANPKIFPLERTDCAISFAGDTTFSYPLMTQIQFFIKSYPKSQNRFQDLCHFKGHLLNMINYTLGFKSDFEIPVLEFLFGGYSWERKRFFLWHIFFDKNINQFSASEVRTWKGIKVNRVVSFIGDYHLEFQERLIKLMKDRHKFINGYFDMEPFEVLVQMIREDTFEKIGGSPQLLKIYEHMNRSPIAVKWNIGKKEFISLLGRPLQDYEKSNYPIIDPDTLEIGGGFIYGK